MRNFYIALGILLFLASCGGHRSTAFDSLEESDSIMIDEGTLLSSDSVAASEDSIKKVAPKLRFSSADDLKEHLKKSSHADEYSEGIIPLISEHSLEYAEKLVNNTHDGFIIVDKGRMKVVLFDKYGREKLSYGMACAKNYGTKHKKADSRTPEGYFTASGIYDSTEWLFTDDNGKTSPKKGQFGPRFIRLNCPNTSQIGIHGTVATWSIGRRTSHGCIRITNENILELVKHVTVGMPIIVVPGKKDMEVNASEDVEVAWIPSTLGAKQPKVKEAEDLKEKTDSISTESHPKENLTENGKQNSDWVERKDSTMNSEVPEPVEEDEHKTSAPINHIENPE